MLKSIFLVLITIFIFTGCHRHQHNVLTSVLFLPIVIVESVFIGPGHGGNGGHRNHSPGHRRAR